MLFIISLFLIVAAFYWFLIKPTFYWKERGVPYQKPWILLGNTASTLFRKISMFEQAIEFYNAFPDKRYCGVFQFTKPMLIIRDLDLIKQITIKDFDHFTDHNQVVSSDDPLMGKHLFALKGQRWRDMRATLSPSFTSSKMRYMFVTMSECAERFSAHIEKKAANTFVVEVKDLYTRFTNDVIASVVFGYDCDSIAEPENEFFLLGKEVTNFTGWRLMKFFLIAMNPFLSKWLKLTIFSEKITNFFRNIVKDNIEKREKNGIVRPDMMQLLMDARSGRSKHIETLPHDSVDEGFASVKESNLGNVNKESGGILTHEDITAQAFVFFFSGFDTVATFTSLISYELALNVDVQEKLQTEVDETLQNCNGKITYTALLGMKYLDMVVSETLRKWCPGFQTDRLCIKDYEIKPVLPDEKPIVIEKGTVLIIPVIGIHRDPNFYHNPEKFDPERFNDENKQHIQQFAFIPFGAGPRNCVASRFALLETKTLLFHLMSKFTITVVEKTPIPLVFSKNTFNMVPDEGYWLGFKLRKE